MFFCVYTNLTGSSSATFFVVVISHFPSTPQCICGWVVWSLELVVFMSKSTTWGVILIAAAGLLFLLTSVNSFEVDRGQDNGNQVELPQVPEAEEPEAEATVEEEKEAVDYGDIEAQEPLQDPPEVIKAVYATSWSAGSQSKMDYLIDLINTTELNAIVIDIKDYSGLVAYDTDVPQVNEYNAEEIRITRPNALIKRLHDNGIYVIARQTVFQDPALVAARPDLAVKNSATGGVWKDRKGISWIDPASKEAWDYNIAISRDAAERGFDEINFDYIRFPSDGDLSVISYPFFSASSTLKATAMAEFFKYLNSNLSDVKTSADLFGLSTVNYDGLGIGQVIENAYRYFDYVSPMVYPSHYANGFQGYANPSLYPYEVVNYSMVTAVARLDTLRNATGTGPVVYAELRPWLQDFDLGADYTADMVRAQIKATYDADPNLGWMLWDPRNNYTEGALESN